MHNRLKKFSISIFIAFCTFGCSKLSSNNPSSSHGTMITRWDISAPNLTVTLPLQNGYAYNFTVDWGDGSPTQKVISWDDANITHTYNTAGVYDVTLTGRAEAWGDYTPGGCRITEVLQLGNMGWKSFNKGFFQCHNLIVFNSEGTDFSLVTDMSSMFQNAYKANPDVSHWDVSNVTDMNFMFSDARVANPDVSQWNVGQVTDMAGMFQFARIANPEVSHWDVSKVTSMSSMFYGAYLANPDVSHWDVSNVTDMNAMFYGASTSNPDVSQWNVSNVTSMGTMFADMLSGNPDVSKWDVSSVTNMNYMFFRAYYATPDVSKWDVSSVTTMAFMFKSATHANPDMSQWNIREVTNMTETFLSSGLTTQNYTDFLIMANNTSTKNNVTLGANSKYHLPAASAARANLVSKGWTINDSGLQP